MGATNNSGKQIDAHHSQLLTQLTDWYNSLDLVDKADVDTLMNREAYDEVFDKYYTAPGFPNKETIQWD